MHITLTPAYGRDYTKASAIAVDLAAGKDFIIADFGHRFSGKPVNREQLLGDGVVEVRVRYDGLRKVAVLPIGVPA